MFCPKCGKENIPEAKYCVECALPLQNVGRILSELQQSGKLPKGRSSIVSTRPDAKKYFQSRMIPGNPMCGLHRPLVCLMLSDAETTDTKVKAFIGDLIKKMTGGGDNEPVDPGPTKITTGVPTITPTITRTVVPTTTPIPARI
jgi:hypothetical protein